MKNKRQSKIVELIKTREVCTQGELSQLLKNAGFQATQATVSRDIRELKLTKATAAGGALKYVLPSASAEQQTERHSRTIKDGLLSATCAGNMLVLRTRPGTAMAVATSLDAMKYKEVLGSVAGDDTILCVVDTDLNAKKLAEDLHAL